MKRFSKGAKYLALPMLAAMLISACSNELSPDGATVIQSNPSSSGSGPAPAPTPEPINPSVKITKFNEGNHIVYDAASNSYVIDGSKVDGWNYVEASLAQFGNEEVKLDFSCDMTVTNSGSKSENLMWQITQGSNYPVLTSHGFNPGKNTWHFEYSNEQQLSNSSFYLSTYSTTKEALTIEISNFSLKVTPVKAEVGDKVNWLDAESLLDAYKKHIDYFGFAVEWNQLSNDVVQAGLRRHANTITMGNEFKVDSVFGHYAGIAPVVDAKFTSSKGVTIDVPSNLPYFNNVDQILQVCKDNGLQMRGHVLVWHSQSNTKFFRENFDASKPLVSKEVMDARQEWYIKSVLEHIKEWERVNNNGKHIIWAWDVVNEAMADDANVDSGKWLRGATEGSKNGSDWYNVYGNEDFIISAFQYANKYAPSDVLLCYNDYNSYMENKTKAICKIVDEIKATSDDENLPGRIDVVGMQSHVLDDFPSPETFDIAIKAYVAKGVDVHVTEFDLNNRKAPYSESLNGGLYYEYFKTMLNNKKTSSNNGVTCITIWGLDDKSSWLHNQRPVFTPYPLLFTKIGSEYYAKADFYKVLEAAE